MKKLFVFDLDGTLVDSIYDLGDAVNEALRAFGLPEHTVDVYRTLVGNGMEELVRRSMGEKGTDDKLYTQVRAVFDEYYHSHCNDKTVYYDGIPQLLAQLKYEGIKTAVFSNKAHVYIGNILKKNFPDHAFDLYRGQVQGVPRKPDSKGFQLILDELGVSADECVYVGDSEVDVATAQNAGVLCVAVTWGYRSKAQLESAGAEIIVHTPMDVLKYLK